MDNNNIIVNYIMTQHYCMHTVAKPRLTDGNGVIGVHTPVDKLSVSAVATSFPSHPPVYQFTPLFI
jgi:hypothetical protein